MISHIRTLPLRFVPAPEECDHTAWPQVAVFALILLFLGYVLKKLAGD